MPTIMTFHDESRDSMGPCAQCGASQQHLISPAKMKKCGGCKAIWYCSERCQRAAQESHRSECRAIRTGDSFDTASKAYSTPTLHTKSPAPPPNPPPIPTMDLPPFSLPVPGPSYRPVMRRLALPSVPGKTPRGMGITPIDLGAIGYRMTAHGLYNPMLEEEKRTAVVAEQLGENPQSSSSVSWHMLSHIFPPNTYLSSLSTEEAFHHIIDCFRLKMEDEHVMCLLNLGIYGGGSNKPLWKKYMALVGRSGILPIWWNKTKRKELEVIANDEDGDYFIEHAVQRIDIEVEYGDGSMPVRLREMAGKIFEPKDTVGKWYE